MIPKICFHELLLFLSMKRIYEPTTCVCVFSFVNLVFLIKISRCFLK